MERKARDPNIIRAPRSVAMNEAEFAILKKAAKISGMDRGPFVAMLSKEYLNKQYALIPIMRELKKGFQ